MTVTIESSSDFDLEKIIQEIDYGVNRGDGIYLDLEHAKIRLTHIEKLK